MQKIADGSYAAPGNNLERARVLADGGVELTTANNLVVHFALTGTYRDRPRYAAVSLTTQADRTYILVRDTNGRLTEVRDPEGRSLRLSYRDIAYPGNPFQVVSNLMTAAAPGQWLDVAIPAGALAKGVHLHAAYGAKIAEVQFFAEGSSQPLKGIPVSDDGVLALDGMSSTSILATPTHRTIGYTFAPGQTVRVNRVKLLTPPGAEKTLLGSNIVIDLATVPMETLPVIDKIETSDGRTVRYDYEITAQGLGGQVVLTAANYGDGTSAHYRYSIPDDKVGSGALLVEADDPRYSGQAKHIKYSYYQPQVDELPAGTIKAEINPSTGRAWARLEFDKADPQKRTVFYSDDRFHVYRILADGSGRIAEQTDSLGHKTKFEYGPGRWSKPKAVVDHAGRRTEWDRDDHGRVISFRDYKGRQQTVDRDRNGNIRRITNAQGHTKTKERDVHGRLTRMVSTDGSVHELTYNEKGQLSAYKALGRDFTFTYDNFGRRTRFHDNVTGATTLYGYNAHGLVESQTDALGRNTHYERNERGLVISTVDPLGLRRAYRYDNYGRKTGATDLLGRNAEYTYDDLSRLTRVVGFTGGVTTYEYAEFPGGCGACSVSPHPTRIVTPDGIASDMLYDAEGRLLSRTVASGMPEQTTTTYTYDDDSNLTAVSDPLGRVTRYTYDDEHHRISATDPMGHTMLWSYDEEGNIASVTTPDGAVTRNEYDINKRLIKTSDAGGNVTRFNYDTTGNLSAIIKADGQQTRLEYNGNRRTAMTFPDGSRQTWAYDTAGRVVKEVSPDGVVTSLDYDAGNHPLKVARVISSTSSDTTIYTYDSLGHRLTSTDALGRTTKWAYDAHGNVLAVTQSDGIVGPRNTYDAQDNLLTTTDALGATTVYTYDVARNPTSLTDAKGNVYRFTYDATHRKTGMIYPDGAKETWSYDPAGQLYSYTNRSGQTKTLAYNLAGQPISETWAQSSSPLAPTLAPNVAYTYNAAGQLATLENGLARLTYSYDTLGRLATETTNLSTLVPGLSPSTVSYSYDKLGQRQGLIYPDGTKVTYAYDARNRLVSVNDGRSGLPIATYAYDPLGRIAVLTRDNGVQTSYQYDLAGQLTDIMHTQDHQTLALSHYDLDPLGRRIAQTRDDNLTERYTYDSTSQLTGVDYSTDKTESLTYDAVGNRTTATDGVTGAPPRVTTYTANNLNQYTQVNGVAFAYDANGNLLADGTQRYVYNANNQLIVAENTATRAEFFYDAKSRCILRKYYTKGTHGQWVLNTTDSRALTYDASWNLLAERTLDGRQVGEYIHGQRTDEILQWIRRDGAKLYPLADGLGSTMALTKKNGGVVERYRYSAYGQPTVQTSDYRPLASGVGYRFLFSGREWLSQVGLNDHRYRYYSPSLGRWLNTDPIGLRGGLILYCYTNNYPTQWSDPYGLTAGDAYSTPQAAACAALKDSNPSSKAQNIEYAGVIYERDGGGYTYTAPWPGTKDSSSPFAIYVGDINKVVGKYHTHGNYTDASGNPTPCKSKDTYDSDNFSDVDKQNATDLQYYYMARSDYKQTYSFLGTPSGSFLQDQPNAFLPDAGQISNLTCP